MKQMIGLAAVFDPKFLRRFQQTVGAHYICIDEGIWPGDRAVDMALCCEVNDRVDVVLGKKRIDKRLVTDRTMNKFEPLLCRNIRQITLVARIG